MRSRKEIRKQKNFFLIFTLLWGVGINFLIPYEKIEAAQDTSENINFTTAVEDVAQRVGPTVVSIRTEKIENYRPQHYFYGPFHDEFFQRFFEEFYGEQPERQFKRSGLGSGVIIDKQGYILTNEHVINDTDKITVTLADGREFKAVLKGTDPRSDLAVIKIDAPNLPVAPLGDSDQLKTGQWVVAIGNPFGYLLANSEPTVTAGVISALHRSLPRTSRQDSDYSDLIQTDAAINPGNSGGPLVNLKGEVVGINVAIFTTSGGYQGIGFAIPANNAKRIVEQLIKGQKVAYGWIGISIQEVDDRLAQYFGLEKPKGVLVVKSLENGPAQKGGVQDGDIIVSIDGQEINNSSSLLRKIGNAKIGDKITLEILRDNKTDKIPVTVGKRPSFDQEGRMIEEGEEEPRQSNLKSEPQHWRGLKVNNIPPELAEQLQLPTSEGVIVVDVSDNSAAEEAGLRKGDIIVSINKTLIRNVEDFNRTVESVKGSCLVRTLRGYRVIQEK